MIVSTKWSRSIHLIDPLDGGPEDDRS